MGKLTGPETGGGGGAPTNAEYLTLSFNATLTDERLFTPGTNLSAVDGGPGGAYTLNAASSGAPVNAQYLVVALDGTLTDERKLTAGTAISFVDGGAGADLTLSVAAFGITTALIANKNVTFGKIQDLAAFSVFGKFNAGVGTGADIVAADETVLGRTATGNLTFAQLATGQITNAAVTYAKIQNVTDARLLGRSAGGAGAPQELTVASPVTLAGGILDFDETVALGNNARVAVSENSGATIGTRRRINFVEGSNVTLTITDDAGNEEIDVTIAAAGAASPDISTCLLTPTSSETITTNKAAVTYGFYAITGAFNLTIQGNSKFRIS